MTRYTLVIGIDPDVERNEVAELHTSTRKLDVEALGFADTVERLFTCRKREAEAGGRILVAVEAGWLNESNWHLSRRDTLRSAAAKGNAVGRNHETGRKLAEMCRWLGLELRLVKPLALHLGGSPMWKGKDGKITQPELETVTGQRLGRTNQEQRDAALLAWTAAGLPLRLVGERKGGGR